MRTYDDFVTVVDEDTFKVVHLFKVLSCGVIKNARGCSLHAFLFLSSRPLSVSPSVSFNFSAALLPSLNEFLGLGERFSHSTLVREIQSFFLMVGCHI